MNRKLKTVFKRLLTIMQNLGFNPLTTLELKFYRRFRKDRAEWLKQGGRITKTHMILSDYMGEAGVANGHYFHQDLLVSKLINEHSPERHVDVGSRIDGFVAHVASYREIEVLDIRPLKQSIHENIKFTKADLSKPINLGEIDSVSCLHAIEHFGLGRYTDKVDVHGHQKGIKNLVALVSQGGRLYISFPIGQNDETHFNAHRIFHPETIFQHPDIEREMKLIRFDFVDDYGELHIDQSVTDVPKNLHFGCGIYTFEKTS